MTREEAIEILNKGYTPRGDRESFKRYFLAREMAIRSLEAWEKLIKFAESEQENNGTSRVHIDDIKKFYKEVENADSD